MVTQATGPYDTYDMHAKNEVRFDQSNGFFQSLRRPVSLSLLVIGGCVVSLGLIGHTGDSLERRPTYGETENSPIPIREGLASVASVACNPLKLCHVSVFLIGSFRTYHDKRR